MAVDVNKQLDRAQRYLEKNKVEDAIEAYQSVLRDVPGNVDALQALGDLFSRLNQSDRAASYYSQVFDRFLEMHEETKALAVYARALKAVPQPPERMARFALLLQKQNRAEEAIEQFTLASELFLARGKEEAALDCLDRVAQLGPDDASRQSAAGELAERLGRIPLAIRAFVRAAQLMDGSGDTDAALELLARAHNLAPHEPGAALVYSQALLRKGDAVLAAKTLDPLSGADLGPTFLSTFGEALMESGDLDRARVVFERLPSYVPTFVRLFELAKRYLAVGQDDGAVNVLRKVQHDMLAARCEHDFTVQLDALVESKRDSLGLAEFRAAAYAELNREVKYFDALVRLFDMYLEKDNVEGSCEILEKLVDIDPYDSRNQERMDRLAKRADPAFHARLRARLSQVATNMPEASITTSSNTAMSEARDSNDQLHTLEDLIVQAEIFMQYSLQAKAVERLQKIIEQFPGEEQRNERFRNVCRQANWSPAALSENSTGPAAVATAAPDSKGKARGVAGLVNEPSSDSVDTMRDLARISEISQSLLRMTSPRAILAASINEIGTYLRATRCIAVIGPPGKPPQMATEFCAPGVEPAAGGVLVRLLAQFDRAAPDAMGGLPLQVSAAPILGELGLQTALGVVLNDPDMRTPAGMVVAGYADAHAWRPSETYFLQAVGDQVLLGISHTRLRAMARNLGATDDRSGLLARGSYQDCLLNETLRAKSQAKPLALALVQLDHGPELLRELGEAQMDFYVEQLGRALESAVRQTDLAVKYTSWAIAFILPDTPLAGAQALAEKLRQAGAEVRPPWEGKQVTLSASVAEAVARIDYDTEDIVTELINRAESGLEQAYQQGGDKLVTPDILGNSHS